MNELSVQRAALQQMRDMLRQFIRGDLEVAAFVPSYAALFAPFDPPDRTTEELSDEEYADLSLFIRLMGGWFGEYNELIPRNPSWIYGQNDEPYGWIDGPGYREWISEEAKTRNLSP